MVFIFERGPLSLAIETQGIVLLDEINLAPSDVLGVLCGLFCSPPEESFATRNERLCRRSTIFIAAMNPTSSGGGRQELPYFLRSLMTTVHLRPFDDAEVRSVAHAICSTSFARAEAALHTSSAEDVPGSVRAPAKALREGVSKWGTGQQRLLDAALELTLRLREEVS